MHKHPPRVVAAFAICFVGLVSNAAFAAPPTFTYGPIVGRGETPDKMIVKWGTSASSATSLYYRKVGDATWMTATGTASADHEIVLGSLATGTSYEYAFANADPAYATTATCPAPGSPMDVVFYGDNRPPFLGTTQHAAVIAAVAATTPDLVINSGDLSLGGTAAEMTSGVLAQISSLAKATPYMSAPGNHETTLGYTGNFDRFFPTPRGAAEAWRSYYAFTCGNAMFLVLDSNDITGAAQKTFFTGKLAAAAADTTIDHIFVSFHHAAYSVGTHGDNAQVQTEWVPLFDAAPKVRAVFNGHDHLYGRFNNGSSVAYVVTGGAGADLYDDTGTSAAMKVTSKKTYNFVSVHIAGKSFSLKAVDLTGTTLDTLDVGMPSAPDMAGASADLGSSGGGDAGVGGGGDGGETTTTTSHGCSYAGSEHPSPTWALLLFALLPVISRRRARSRA